MTTSNVCLIKAYIVTIAEIEGMDKQFLKKEQGQGGLKAYYIDPRTLKTFTRIENL